MSDPSPPVDPADSQDPQDPRDAGPPLTRLDEVAPRFAGTSPVLSRDPARIQASVALILCEVEQDLAVLFIQRASHPGDRWSGHIAFPGGRVEAADADAAQTAERETLEEVGLSIDRTQLVGRLNDLQGYSESILVSGFVYTVPGVPRLVPNHEVASAFWLSFSELESPERHLIRPFDYRGDDLILPAIRVLDVEEPLLWGLSYHFLELLMVQCGRRIPSMPWSPEI